MTNNLVIDVQLIRSLVPKIVESFEGTELPELGSDKEENLFLAVAIVKHLKSFMKGNSIDYVPTSVDFVRTVRFSKETEEEGKEVIILPSGEKFDEYISAVEKPIAMSALSVNAMTESNKDGHLILSTLLFAMLVLNTHYNVPTVRQVIVDTLESH